MGGYIEVRFAVVKGHVVCCVLERYKPAVDNLADVSKQAVREEPRISKNSN